MRATIINYGVGNLFSIYSGLRSAGFEVSISLSQLVTRI